MDDKQTKRKKINKGTRKRLTQLKMMLEYLQSGKSFTSLEALHLFGSIQPAARIWELKNKFGVSGIVTEMVRDERTGKRYARYRLVGVRHEAV